MSKTKLLQAISLNTKNDFVRQFCFSSSNFARREVIKIDAFEDVEDVPTHTGQKFEMDDRRRLRFKDYTRYVNPNIAMELIEKVPPIPSKERVVWCDGGDEHLGHPKVFINLDKPGNHTCGYCGLRFFKEDTHGH